MQLEELELIIHRLVRGVPIKRILNWRIERVMARRICLHKICGLQKICK
jgi:hypothetical protein